MSQGELVQKGYSEEPLKTMSMAGAGPGLSFGTRIGSPRVGSLLGQEVHSVARAGEVRRAGRRMERRSFILGGG